MIPLTSGHRLETANQEIRRAVFEMEGDDLIILAVSDSGSPSQEATQRRSVRSSVLNELQSQRAGIMRNTAVDEADELEKGISPAQIKPNNS